MDNLKALYDAVAAQVPSMVAALRTDNTGPTSWILVDDETGVAIRPAELTEDQMPSSTVVTLVEEGARGGAYVRYYPTKGTVLAVCAAGSPVTTDVREAAVRRRGGEVAVEPWAHTV